MDMNIPAQHVLKVEKSLHGIPESGLHWYWTYIARNMTNLGTEWTRTDPYLRYKNEGEIMTCIIILLVDDSFIIRSQSFLVFKEHKAKVFCIESKRAAV